MSVEFRMSLLGHRFYQNANQIDHYKDFCANIQKRVVALILVSVGNFFGYDPSLFGRAEILVILALHFGRNDILINSS